ncbi:MAG TPA: hypothetical protein P5567_12685 [Kiritimatiellia bacterium]|nr:hypothetical protein [Kiritimatiellia bacterium]HRZ13298.1 hypothetical protein [Kiritimatiellia bacterium]HSA18747.1 hypothetical protein [Kiritimatiellia bacterium]
MNIRRKGGGGILAAWLACGAALAQVPNQLYMQGVFLQADGATPAPGAHSVSVTIRSNAAVALTRTTNVTANNHGLADFVIADAALPALFRGTTNASFVMTGGATQAFVTAPYAFQAGNLPSASGNFTVQGNLNVASNATLTALTAENGGTLAVPITVARYATFTNLNGVEFGAALDVAGGVTVAGPAEANYDTRFTNTAATTVFLGATNEVVLSNATVRSSFTLLSTNYTTTGTSGTAPADGFLMVWVKTDNHKTSGVNVKIDTLTFKLQWYCDVELSSQNLNLYKGSAFPVAKDVTWSVMLVNASDSDKITITCYWVPLNGEG